MFGNINFDINVWNLTFGWIFDFVWLLVNLVNAWSTGALWLFLSNTYKIWLSNNQLGQIKLFLASSWFHDQMVIFVIESFEIPNKVDKIWYQQYETTKNYTYDKLSSMHN